MFIFSHTQKKDQKKKKEREDRQAGLEDIQAMLRNLNWLTSSHIQLSNIEGLSLPFLFKHI